MKRFCLYFSFLLLFIQTPAWAATDATTEPSIFDRVLKPIIDVLSILGSDSIVVVACIDFSV